MDLCGLACPRLFGFFFVDNGIYTHIDGVLAVIADGNTPVPGGTGTFSDVGRPWICDFEGGTVVFRGHGTNGEKGVYSNAGGALRVVADLNTLIPEGTGTFTRFGKVNTVFGNVPTMDGGNVAFYGEGADGQKGIYLEWNGSLSKVADLNTPIPGGAGNFLSLGGPLAAQIEGDTVVFANGVETGLYRSVNGALSLIVEINTPVPSSTPAVVFVALASQGFGLSSGAVSFLAPTTDNSGGNVYTTLGGSLTKVIAAGDIVDGVALSGFGTYGNGIDGDSIAIDIGIQANRLLLKKCIPVSN